MRSASVVGAIFLFPYAAIVASFFVPADRQGSIIPVGIVLSVPFGWAFVGVYALALGLAIESSIGKNPMKRIFIVLTSVALAKTGLIILVLLTLVGLSRLPEGLHWWDFFAEPAAVLGWCLGLLLNPRASHVLRMDSSSKMDGQLRSPI